jgi:integrase
MGGDLTRELSRHPAGRHPAATLVAVTSPPITKGTSMSIRKLHSKGCPSREGGRCRCGAGWEAAVYSKRDDKKIRKTFASRVEAKSWRDDANAQLAKGGLRAPKPITLREAWEAWIEGSREGTIRNRSGDPFKPSALRAYEGAMRREVLTELGAARVADLSRAEVQALADRLLAQGLSASAIQVTLLPLRAIFRRAISQGDLALNPCTGLELPAVRGRRDRYASPEEAEALIAAVPEHDRPIWATAMYGGLRLGELRALRVEEVDLAVGMIRVERGWDPSEGEIELKSRAGRRKVPIPAILRDYLVEHLVWSKRQGAELIFGNTPEVPFTPNMLQRRADQAWAEAGIERITPHACRHTFASLMIAAGVNAKALSTFMGHAKIGITLDRYGHLMPGSEEEAASLLDAYLTAQRERAEEAARSADVVHHDGLTGEQTGEQLVYTHTETADLQDF